MVLDQDTAAALCGITSRRLRQLDSEDDPPPKDVNGKYPAREFGDWLKRRHLSGLIPVGDGKVLDLNAERARLAKEQADKTALENEEKRGVMVDVREIVDRWAAVGTNIKARLLSIPTKAAPLVLGCKTLPQVREVLAQLINDVLSELSASPPGIRSGAGSIQEPEAAADTDSKPVGGRKKKTKSRKRR